VPGSNLLAGLSILMPVYYEAWETIFVGASFENAQQLRRWTRADWPTA
jgi:hypothetical protein